MREVCTGILDYTALVGRLGYSYLSTHSCNTVTNLVWKVARSEYYELIKKLCNLRWRVAVAPSKSDFSMASSGTSSFLDDKFVRSRISWLDTFMRDVSG